MPIASVQFTSTQLAEITRLRDAAKALPVDAVGAYAPITYILPNLLTMPSMRLLISECRAQSVLRRMKTTDAMGFFYWPLQSW